MKGLIQEHPLAELIREISLAGLNGALRLERERVKFVLYFEAGVLHYAASNLRPHRLSECLKRWAVLPEAELAAIKEADNDTKLLAALFSTSRFDEAALHELVQRQVTEVLRPALLLTDGVWYFDPRARLIEDVRAKVETSVLAIESARRLPSEFVASRFPRTDEKLAPEPNFPAHLNLLPQEGFVLSRVDSKTSVRALIAISGLPEVETLRALYALTLGGFLLRDNWPQAFTAEAIEKLRAAAQATPETSATAQASAASVGARKEASAPVVAEPPQPKKEELDQPLELEELFARMNVASNYYEVLGVGQRAEARDIKRAYHQLARRFHPDRFHQEQNRDLHSRIESAFARIAQAYETLRDKQLRAAYDLKLKSPKTAATAAKDLKQQAANVRTKTEAQARTASNASKASNPQAMLIQAEENFQQGIAAMRDGQRTRAVSLLREAARLAPRHPNYRAYYGRALAANEETRRMAEAEFQAAITLDGGNASYHVMLAELYHELGFQKRAQTIAEHALELDPRNVAARLLLDKMKQK